MAGMVFGHALETVHDGLTVFLDGRVAPVPLVETRIDVEIRAGLAVVKTLRRFRNTEDRPVEALLTMPVGFDAAVTGLRARIDGRAFTATAQEKSDARDSYEAALEEGRLTVLHEELLRGIHMLSVGNLAPAKEVEVEIESVSALSRGPGGPFLRLPVTAGQLYGASPFTASDDLVVSDAVRHVATLTVNLDEGAARLADGAPLDEPTKVVLDHAIEIVVGGGRFGSSVGRAADGRIVRLDLRPIDCVDGTLNVAILVDHSGSTASPSRPGGGRTVWDAMRHALSEGLSGLGPTDRIDLWEFDSAARRIGVSTGPGAAALVAGLKGPAGGTELGGAVRAVRAAGATDILVMTDGQTWASTVDELIGEETRISTILVGSDSLDANIGQLCAATGGQFFYAPGDDVSTALAAALTSLRLKGSAVRGTVGQDGPERAVALRGGVEITAVWAEATELGAADSVGRFAAALTLPLLPADRAEDWARSHALCTHRTSLVLINTAGEAVTGMPQMRKVPLMASVDPAAAHAIASMGSGVVFRRRGESATYPRKRPPGDKSRPTVAFNLGSAEDEARALRRMEAKRRTRQINAQFASVAWDKNENRFADGDLSVLTPSQMVLVIEIAANHDLQDFARASGFTEETIALALIADAVGDRLALRFVGRIFAAFPGSLWHPLRGRVSVTQDEADG